MTIVADKGRLSVDEINLMVTEAETKGELDKAMRNKIES